MSFGSRKFTMILRMLLAVGIRDNHGQMDMGESL